MPATQVQVGSTGNISATDGSLVTQLGGKAGEGIIAELHGKYFTQTYRGNCFIGATASAGVIPPLPTATAQTFALWNPAGSGKLLVPIKVSIGLVTVGVVTAHFCWSYLLNAGSNIGTAAPVSAHTLVAPVNAYLSGPGVASAMRFAPATMTTLATAYLRPIGVSNFMATTPTAANMFWQLTEYYDGDMIVGPGTVVAIANNIGAVATYGIAVTWEEVPI